MSSHRLAAFAGGLVFLCLALIGLYRLLFWFPITVAGQQVGQTMSFFAFVIFLVLSLISFQAVRNKG